MMMVTGALTGIFQDRGVSYNKDTSKNISFLTHELKTAQAKTFLMFLSCSYFWKNFSLHVLIKFF